MVEAQPYRTIREVPLVRLESFCRCVQNALAATHPAADLERFWRLYVSAECSGCGIRISGDELRALAFPPCIELATAKTGRMRRGDCARLGCEAWHYSVHFWNQEEIDWSSMLIVAEQLIAESVTPPNACRAWQAGLVTLRQTYTSRAATMLVLLLVLWFARELYLGGPIPFLRESEKFVVDPTPAAEAWPAPIDGSDGPMNR